MANAGSSATATGCTPLEVLTCQENLTLRAYGRYGTAANRTGRRTITDFTITDHAKPANNIILVLSVDESSQEVYLKDCDHNVLFFASQGVMVMTEKMLVYNDWKSSTPIGELIDYSLTDYSGSGTHKDMKFYADGEISQHLWHHVGPDLLSTMVIENTGTVTLFCLKGIYNTMERVLLVFFMLRCFYCVYFYLKLQPIPMCMPCSLSPTNDPPIFSSTIGHRIVFRPLCRDVIGNSLTLWMDILSAQTKEVLMVVKNYNKKFEANEILDQCGDVRYYTAFVKQKNQQTLTYVYRADGVEIGFYNHYRGLYYLSSNPTKPAFRHWEEFTHMFIIQPYGGNARLAEVHDVPNGRKASTEMDFTCTTMGPDLEAMFLFSGIEFCLRVFHLHYQPLPRLSYNYRPKLTT